MGVNSNSAAKVNNNEEQSLQKRNSRIETFLSEDFNEKFINNFTNQITTQLESIFVQSEEQHQESNLLSQRSLKVQKEDKEAEPDDAIR